MGNDSTIYRLYGETDPLKSFDPQAFYGVDLYDIYSHSELLCNDRFEMVQCTYGQDKYLQWYEEGEPPILVCAFKDPGEVTVIKVVPPYSPDDPIPAGLLWTHKHPANDYDTGEAPAISFDGKIEMAKIPKSHWCGGLCAANIIDAGVFGDWTYIVGGPYHKIPRDENRFHITWGEAYRGDLDGDGDTDFFLGLGVSHLKSVDNGKTANLDTFEEYLFVGGFYLFQETDEEGDLVGPYLPNVYDDEGQCVWPPEEKPTWGDVVEEASSIIGEYLEEVSTAEDYYEEDFDNPYKNSWGGCSPTY